MSEWIGVDLDGTLAEYNHGEFDPDKIGPPIPAMVERVKRWLAEGKEVRIVTARVYDHYFAEDGDWDAMLLIYRWSIEHLGKSIPVVCFKDYNMLELWDDRAVAVEANTGKQLSPSTRGL